MLHRSIRTIFLVIGLAGGSPVARAESTAWGAIIGAEPDRLTPAEKARALENLERIRNTRGCIGTLADCLAKGDRTARRHAGFVVRMIKKGKTDPYIEKGIAARAASAFPDKRFNVKLKDHVHIGDVAARVVVVEFACFQCPFCAHLATELDGLKQRFGNRWAFYLKFFPVRSHPRGVAAALAALAAQRQGKFWPMVQLLFANRADLDDDDFERYAKQLGLDMIRFRSDLADPRSLAFIQADKLDGMALGVEGTPSFFVNGKLYKSLYEYPEIVDRIEEEFDIVEKRIP